MPLPEICDAFSNKINHLTCEESMIFTNKQFEKKRRERVGLLNESGENTATGSDGGGEEEEEEEEEEIEF